MMPRPSTSRASARVLTRLHRAGHPVDRSVGRQGLTRANEPFAEPAPCHCNAGSPPAGSHRVSQVRGQEVAMHPQEVWIKCVEVHRGSPSDRHDGDHCLYVEYLHVELVGV
jgi:hypothetical protein